VRESLWCLEAEGSKSAVSSVSDSYFPESSLGIGKVPHYLYHVVHLFIDPEFTEISLVSFQDAASPCPDLLT